MAANGARIYKFDSFVLDPSERRLKRDGDLVVLKPKSFDLLLTLVRSGGRLITKEELLREVWDGAAIEESNITVHISALRKALGDQKGNSRFIENVPKFGYRFTAEVEVKEKDTEASAPEREPAAQALAVTSGTANAPLLRPIQIKRLSRIALVLGIVVVASTLTILAFTWSTATPPRLANSVFLQTRMTRLTTSGNSFPAAVSRDGKYVAYVVRAGGKQSLWLRVVANSSDLQLLPPEHASYASLTISSDNQMIYYDKSRESAGIYGIYQIPLLGGVEKKLVDGTSGSQVSFSPDGRYFTFVRWNVAEGSDDVWIASADGTGLRRLASHKIDQGDTCSPAWSPDGKLIVCAWGAADSSMGLFAIQVADGKVAPLLARKWNEIQQVVWLNDASGLAVTAKERATDNLQIWLVTYPNGEARRVTNDLNDYVSLSLTSDSSTLAAIRADRESNIWSSVGPDGTGIFQITSNNYDADNDQGLAWTPENKIVYASKAAGKHALWVMDQDGGNRRQLTDYSSSSTMPAVTPDGSHIVFVSDRGPGGKLNLWKMEIDGSNPRQLTSGPLEFLPQISPDGKWIVYHSYTAGEATIGKIPIDGGEPALLVDHVLDTYSPVSPDGRFVACVYLDERGNSKNWKIAIVPFSGGAPIKLFDARPSPLRFAPLRWTRDGKNLAYLDRTNGVSNVWLLNLQNGEAKQMTNFGSNSAWYFDWHKDGRLAISRGKTVQDVVLISNVQQQE